MTACADLNWATAAVWIVAFVVSAAALLVLVVLAMLAPAPGSKR